MFQPPHEEATRTYQVPEREYPAPSPARVARLGVSTGGLETLRVTKFARRLLRFPAKRGAEVRRCGDVSRSVSVRVRL